MKEILRRRGNHGQVIPDCPMGIDLIQYSIDELGYEWEDGYAYRNGDAAKVYWGGTWAAFPKISLHGADYISLQSNRREYCFYIEKDGTKVDNNASVYSSSGGINVLPSDVKYANNLYIVISRRNPTVWYKLYAYKGQPVLPNENVLPEIIYRPWQWINLNYGTTPLYTSLIPCSGMKSFRWLYQGRGYFRAYDSNRTQIYRQPSTNVYAEASYDLPDGTAFIDCEHWQQFLKILVQFHDVTLAELENG